MKNIVIDGHLHIYPFYDYALALKTLFNALDNVAMPFLEPGETPVRIALMAERRDCKFFRDLPTRNSGFKIEHLDSNWAMLSDHKFGEHLYILPGRQIVTAERIEVLALTVESDVPDGLPVKQVLNMLKDYQAIPVLAWAPGKWFFTRGNLVSSLLTENEPGSFLLGDTSLRPIGWPIPKLMQQGHSLGYKVIAGSDPLPAFGEERMAGAYGIHVKTWFDPDDPVTSVRKILSDNTVVPQFVGRRCGPVQVFNRLRRHKQSGPRRK
ncbi:MAG: hypothetical protein GX811_04880 [Lentisphaerae bacterium]|nr:hypothetical protein [Lentisphaerota bacterium]